MSRMALIASFVLVIGIPVLLAVLLYAARINRAVKAIVFFLPLGGVALLVYVPRYTLGDIGSVELLALIAVAWVVGFLIAPLPIGLWRVAQWVGRRRASPSTD